MPFYLLSSNNTSIKGDNVWVVDGTREICINYIYYPDTGQIMYAACVFRKSDAGYVLTEVDIKSTEHTARERYQIRPVQAEIATDLSDDTMAIVSAIRYEMCRGAGCKGVRRARTCSLEIPKNDTELSGDDTTSETSDCSFQNSDLLEHFPELVSCFDFTGIPVQRFCYRRFTSADGNKNDDDPKFVHDIRFIFVAWKRVFENSEHERILYGASVFHPYPNWEVGDGGRVKRHLHSLTLEEINSHYETATRRLEVCPVMSMPPGANGFDFSEAEDLLLIESNASNMRQFFDDKIFKRVGGRLQIRGSRLD